MMIDGWGADWGWRWRYNIYQKWLLSVANRLFAILIHRPEGGLHFFVFVTGWSNLSTTTIHLFGITQGRKYFCIWICQRCNIHRIARGYLNRYFGYTPNCWILIWLSCQTVELTLQDATVLFLDNISGENQISMTFIARSSGTPNNSGTPKAWSLIRWLIHMHSSSDMATHHSVIENWIIIKYNFYYIRNSNHMWLLLILVLFFFYHSNKNMYARDILILFLSNK